MSHPQRGLGPDKEAFCLQRSLSGRHTKVSIRSGRWALSQLQTYHSESNPGLGEEVRIGVCGPRSQPRVLLSQQAQEPANVLLGMNHGSL